MIARFKKWLAPPMFPGDEDKTRRAYALNSSLIAALALIPILVLGNWLGNQINWGTLIISCLLMVALFVLRRWMINGAVRSASLGFLAIGYATTTVGVILIGTIRSPITMVYVLLVIFSEFLFERRGTMVMAVLSSITLAGLIAAENLDLLPNPDFSVTISQWIALSVVLLWSGELAYAVLYPLRREIAERKHIETALRESETRLQEIFKNSSDVPYRRNLKTDTYDYMSPAMEQLCGIPAQEFMAMSIETTLRHIHPDDLPTIEKAIADSIAQPGKRIDLEYRFRHINGEWVWFQDRITTILDDAGHPAFRYGSVRDVTERKQIEQMAHASQANLTALIENTNARIWSVDQKYRLIIGNSYFHQAVQAVLGRQLQNGESVLLEQFPPDTLAKWRARYDQALSGECFVADAQTEFAHSPRQIEYRFAPIETENGNIVGVTIPHNIRIL